MVEKHVDSLGTGNEYVAFNAVLSACWLFGRGFSHGYVHEIPVETFHGENEMFDEESEAFEVMPTFLRDGAGGNTRVSGAASAGRVALGLCPAGNLRGLA